MIFIIIIMKAERQPMELIAFVQNQNRILREENKEFKDLVDLNRQALKIALAPREGQQQLPALVSLLFQENSKLLGRCSNLREQLDAKSCQALISQQIAQASNQHEKYVAGQLKDRLKLLKKELQGKEKRIGQLIKQNNNRDRHEQDDGENEVIVIEITDVTKVSQKMFKEAESLRKEIELKNQQIARLRQQKEEYVKLNLILTKQVNELKVYSCQSTGSQKRDFNTSSSDLSKFLKYQSKIAEHSDDESNEQQHDDSSGMQENSSDEDYMDHESEQKPSKIVQIEKKQESKIQKVSKIVLPKLELKKAKEIQTLIVKKINNDQKKKSGTVIKDQKWKKMEAEMEELRKKMGNQIILKLRFERENNFLKKFISELQQRNQLLLKQRFEDNVEKNYEKQRQYHQDQNLETLLDICRDVTLNQKLRSVCKGKEKLQLRRDFYSKQI